MDTFTLEGDSLLKARGPSCRPGLNSATLNIDITMLLDPVAPTRDPQPGSSDVLKGTMGVSPDLYRLRKDIDPLTLTRCRAPIFRARWLRSGTSGRSAALATGRRFYLPDPALPLPTIDFARWDMTRHERSRCEVQEDSTCGARLLQTVEIFAVVSGSFQAGITYTLL